MAGNTSQFRLPPQSIESEQALLGSIMLRPEVIHEVVDIVVPEAFYAGKHKKIYEAMLNLMSKSDPIDLLSVSTRLKEKKQLEDAGGMSYLTELVNMVPSSANAKYYAELVEKKYMMRMLIEASEHIGQLGYDESQELDELLDQAEKKVFEITNRPGAKQFIAFEALLREARERIAMLHENKEQLRGIPSGYRDLDNLLAGFQKSDLVILAARPSVGKTALALDIARRVAVEHDIPVAYFSLEMSNQQLTDRIVAAEANVNSWHVRTGRPTNEEFNLISEALTRLEKAPLYIDDQAGNKVMSMRSELRRLKSSKGLGLVIVDYLQLIMPSSQRANDSMVQQVTEISRALKVLAKELDVPVIALSQLSRAVEQRGGRPRLSDLRDSGSIEQDADLVMFLHKNLSDEIDVTKDPYDIEVLVEKHRNGPIGKVTLKFHPRQVTFRSIEKHMGELENSDM